MRKLKNALLVCFTLLLAAAGATMPFAVSYMQDARQAAEEVRPFTSFSLTLKQETDLGRILRAVDWENSDFTVSDVAEDAVLTEWEAYNAAQDAMLALHEHGLLYREVLEGLAHPRIMPQTVITGTGGMPMAVLPGPEAERYAEDDYGADASLQATEPLSFATWTVQWEEPSDYYLWLDDASGKVFMIEVAAPVTKVDEDVYVRMENWRSFIEDYYSTEVQDIREMWYDNAAEFHFTLPLGEGEEPVSLTLRIYYMAGFEILAPYP